jgi:hypothetical protein
MKASPKIIQKNENPLHLAQGCFAGAFIQTPPVGGLVKAAELPKMPGSLGKKRKSIK